VSLFIDVDQITAVLVAGTWYDVADYSFALDAYEYVWYPSAERRDQGDFQLQHSGGAGFRFTTKAGDVLVGPIDQVQAIRRAIPR